MLSPTKEIQVALFFPFCTSLISTRHLQPLCSKELLEHDCGWELRNLLVEITMGTVVQVPTLVSPVPFFVHKEVMSPIREGDREGGRERKEGHLS